MRARIAATIIAILSLASGLPAQEDEQQFRSVTNPFGEEFVHIVGEELMPAVDIEGVRWTRLRITAKGDQEIVRGRDIPIVIELEFENRREESVELLVILLLEDPDGNLLERIRLDPFRAAASRFKETRARYKVAGATLLATGNVYLFCEIR